MCWSHLLNCPSLINSGRQDKEVLRRRDVNIVGVVKPSRKPGLFSISLYLRLIAALLLRCHLCSLLFGNVAHAGCLQLSCSIAEFLLQALHLVLGLQRSLLSSFSLDLNAIAMYRLSQNHAKQSLPCIHYTNEDTLYSHPSRRFG